MLQAGAWGRADAAPQAGRDAYRQIYVRLSNGANGILYAPVTPDPIRGRVAMLIAHPEHANVFNSFPAGPLATRGYRVLAMNYYGPERTYEEFLPPLAAAVQYLRGLPGIEKVVLIGESTGGSELTYYQDVAENGPEEACRGPERIYKCDASRIGHLPPADAVILLDANVGAPVRTLSLDPAVTTRHPGRRDAALDMFDPRNGFDPQTGQGHYSAAFTRRFLAAQGRRDDRVIDRALGRLQEIEQGRGKFRDDGPFLVAGFSVVTNGARLDLADLSLMSRTRQPHLLLESDGRKSRQIISSVRPPMASDKDLDLYDRTTPLGSQTVRHYLSFYALRTTSAYTVTADDVQGVIWRSTPNDAIGNVEGVRVPTLVMAGSCYPHMVLNELVFEHSAAKDKQFVAVEGANHSFQPCLPKYGNTRQRTFDFVDAWLLKPGRLSGLTPRFRYFDSAGVRIRYIDVGRGDPVFLLHGNGGSLEDWVRAGFVQSLAQHFRVIAADARGNGDSGKPHATKAYGQQLSLDVLRLMDRLGLAKADIVGYSMGAQTAAHLMIIAPKRLGAVVLGGAPGRFYWTPEDIREVDRHAAEREKYCVSRGMLNARRPTGSPPISDMRFKRLETACFANKRIDRFALAALSRGQATQTMTRAQACAVEVPTLGAVGSHDGYLPRFRQLQACRQNMQLTVIPGASHATAFRSPEFLADTRDFLLAHRFGGNPTGQ